MDVFDLRDRLIRQYAGYVESFLAIRDPLIRQFVFDQFASGQLWPDPLLQLNPSFEPGGTVEDLVAEGVLHRDCAGIFRRDKLDPATHGAGRPLRLHRHQAEAIRLARQGLDYVLTTGTGSGKSLAYIIPIVDHVLRRGPGKGIQAIVVYPMNALANSQHEELQKFLGADPASRPVSFDVYTGQRSREDGERILGNPPDILLTNYVMLELILTRPVDDRLVRRAQGLRFLVLDELHTYRGRQGADVALLVRRAREAFAAPQLQCVGTSATLAGAPTFEGQQQEVAAVASTIFGAPIAAAQIVGETLRRATPACDTTSPEFLGQLAERLNHFEAPPGPDYEAFVADPLVVWLESVIGLRQEEGSGRLVRARPCSLTGAEGAAARLSEMTGVDVSRCERALRETLLAAYRCHPDPRTGFKPFAFRLHQFISRGDSVYATLETDETRHLTLDGQKYKPGDDRSILLPLCFCRWCGQEYYTVSMQEEATGELAFLSRRLSDPDAGNGLVPGYLFRSTSQPWPTDDEQALDRLPEDWVEERRDRRVVRPEFKKLLPKAVWLDTGGHEDERGLPFHYVPAPFRFCLACGVEHRSRLSEFAKLGALSSEGRSTATTILSLFAVRELRQEASLPDTARKLLSFTDNRQDASLQAGHFNDFVETGLLRAALYRAARDGGAEGLRHEVLTQRVFDALGLPLEQFAVNPAVKFGAKETTVRALKEVLGYRVYRDLQRGWRLTAPNLEQCGLLDLSYPWLEELCASEAEWASLHPVLAQAAPPTRQAVARTLLDHLRRALAIKVDYLKRDYQDGIQQQSSQHLRLPWALDDNEVLEQATLAFPRSRRPQDPEHALHVSSRGRFGAYLRRKTTLPHWQARLTAVEVETIIRELFTVLATGGLTEEVLPGDPKNDEVPGYQIPAAALRWTAADGTRQFHDPLATPTASQDFAPPNRFFVEFYRNLAGSIAGFEAREHTAQVDNERRQQREHLFREGKLPVLYCSPTMELGVDISDLNVVHLRNVPPTPANYAQRSGRAGRGGQPAAVLTYCTTLSPHDQYFFKRPELMVCGQVSTPRLDLANEDLIRAHVQAIWLAASGLNLGTSLKEVLDLSKPGLPLLPSVAQALQDRGVRRVARQRTERILATVERDPIAADWWTETWLDTVLDQVSLRFEEACQRWRSLYGSALSQAEAQDRIIRDPARSASDKHQAQRLRREAEAQLLLLTQDDNISQSDFYSYRYFASEGFLPGYSFPRLPLSAFLPGRRVKADRDEFVSRPRFLAISEFGPRAILYHEGARYRIHKVILPARELAADTGLTAIATQRAKQCDNCGYLHPVGSAGGADICERCGWKLPVALENLFRMQNVSTRRQDRITSDEEERQRLGYDVRTGVRFHERAGHVSRRLARAVEEGVEVASMAYGHSACIWRVNLGWRRRAPGTPPGFVIDSEAGFWAKSEALDDQKDDVATGRRLERVIPFVEDHRNALLLEPPASLERGQMASLAAALKMAIQAHFQLEDSELAAVPLPSEEERRLILFYEAAEGGAGVLRRLLDLPDALAAVARKALEICHYDPDTGADLGKGPRARELCTAACYDCLMSYANQRDHQLLDRRLIVATLQSLARCRVEASAGARSRGEQLEALLRQCDSELERDWLRFLDTRGMNLPSAAQTLLEACKTRPDFQYDDKMALVYVDGPHHDFPERRARDAAQSGCLDDLGYTVIRFGHRDDWEAIVRRYPDLFGKA